MLVKDGVIVFGVVGDFADFRVAHGGADGVENGRFPQLFLRQHRLARKKPHLPRFRLRGLIQMADGDVVAGRRRDGKADADDFGLHFVQTGRLHIEADRVGVI